MLDWVLRSVLRVQAADVDHAVLLVEVGVEGAVAVGTWAVEDYGGGQSADVSQGGPVEETGVDGSADEEPTVETVAEEAGKAVWRQVGMGVWQSVAHKVADTLPRQPGADMDCIALVQQGQEQVLMVECNAVDGAIEPVAVVASA